MLLAIIIILLLLLILQLLLMLFVVDDVKTSISGVILKSSIPERFLADLRAQAPHSTSVHHSIDSVDELRTEETGGAALWIIQPTNSHRTVIVDAHHKPIHPHNWARADPVLDVAHEIRGIADAREAGVEEARAVGRHVGAGLAGEDSTQQDRVVELSVHGAVLEDGLLDLQLQSPLKQLSILPLKRRKQIE